VKNNNTLHFLEILSTSTLIKPPKALWVGEVLYWISITHHWCGAIPKFKHNICLMVYSDTTHQGRNRRSIPHPIETAGRPERGFNCFCWNFFRTLAWHPSLAKHSVETLMRCSCRG